MMTGDVMYGRFAHTATSSRVDSSSMTRCRSIFSSVVVIDLHVYHDRQVFRLKQQALIKLDGNDFLGTCEARRSKRHDTGPTSMAPARSCRAAHLNSRRELQTEGLMRKFSTERLGKAEARSFHDESSNGEYIRESLHRDILSD